MNTERLQQLNKELTDAKKRHKDRYGDQVSLLVAEVEKRYAQEVGHVLSFLAQNKKLSEIIASGHNVLKNLFLANRRIGRELCHFGPPLNLWPVEDFPIAMIVYSAVRLADYGIETHREYETFQKRDFYVYLLEEKLNEQQASALNTMLSTAVINAAIQRLNQKNIREVADTILRLSPYVFAGMLAQSFPPSPLTTDLYAQIIDCNFIACQMILDQVFLRKAPPRIRSELLSINSRLFEIGRLIDDLADKENNRSLCCLNILTVPGMDHQKIAQKIDVLFQELWNDFCLLSPKLRDMMAMRMVNRLRI